MVGRGLFTDVSDPNSQSASKRETWVMTPKYNDPFSPDVDRKMAKFIISMDLAAIIAKVNPASVSGDSGYANLIKQGRGFFDFFLQNIDESVEDKFQLVETLGDSYAIFGLGQKPKIFTYSGVLLNTKENDWRLNFIQMYDKYISISRLAKFHQNGVSSNQVTLIYDTVTVRGALLNLRTTLRADNEIAVPFSFSMLITSYAADYKSPSQTQTQDEVSVSKAPVQLTPEAIKAVVFRPVKPATGPILLTPVPLVVSVTTAPPTVAYKKKDAAVVITALAEDVILEKEGSAIRPRDRPRTL